MITFNVTAYNVARDEWVSLGFSENTAMVSKGTGKLKALVYHVLPLRLQALVYHVLPLKLQALVHHVPPLKLQALVHHVPPLKLQALVYHVLPPTTAIIDSAIGL